MMILALVDSLIFSLLIFVLGWAMEKAPGDQPNLFGYKTKMSKKNKDTWGEANRYSGKLFKYVGLILIVISIITSVTLKENGQFVCMPIGLFLILLVYLRTEKHLKSLFDKDGNRLVK